ncbi:hypothetical protein DFR29_109159 [Tahibacter aquaticus]|uniref:Uncharacterized protein n=1 Tax=Tahibacter aquaticus TaxID=520092 RepID=A0A4R6YUF1_9GAMM|nr:hypothetical protein [Tahibacter aquaticus]TDR42103.1 hypothetical protein DFR29_109159 [Tahibacter aquaticus]
MKAELLFSDYFDLGRLAVEKYGALDVCIEADLPLFIDPFLLFSSDRSVYKELHRKIVGHLARLRDLACENSQINEALFQFPEIRQNWLGFSKWGNGGKGLGPKFAKNLISSFNGFYSNFGKETLTKSSHIEKLTLVGEGIGRDFISDFTTNLAQEYLLEYTEKFAKTYLSPHQRAFFSIRCRFDEESLVRQPRLFELPYFYKNGDSGDFIILTPLDILTKDDAFISHGDLARRFRVIANALDNASLRHSINEFFRSNLRRNPTKEDIARAVDITVRKFPEMLDYYILDRERNRGEAAPISAEKVERLQRELLDPLSMLGRYLAERSQFYAIPLGSYAAALQRVRFLKEVIEDNDGYRIFYKGGKPIASEETIQRIFRLTWFASRYDVNSEVNNGRGPADYKISFGQRDSAIVEFKLGSSSSMKRNLKAQTAIYKKASRSVNDIKVILCYTRSEISTVNRILKEIGQEDAENVVTIDASPKISASKSSSPN